MKILLLAVLAPIIGLVLLSKLALVAGFFALKLLFVPALLVAAFVGGYSLGRRDAAASGQISLA